MAEHGAPGPQAVPTPAGRQRACPGARICLGAARPRLTGSFGDRWPGWVVAQPLEGVSASQRALGRRCSGVTVCFVCVCCRRLRGQLGPRAAREGLDVAEAARAALGSTPWVCCSCRLAQIVCGRLVGVCRCGARAVTGSGSWWGGGGRWLERLWVGDGTTGARRRPTGAGTSSCVCMNCPDPCCPLWATSDVSVLLFVLASFCASIRCSRVSGWFAPRQLGGPGRGHRPTERPWVQPPGCAVAAGWCRSCGRGWLGSGGVVLGG